MKLPLKPTKLVRHVEPDLDERGGPPDSDADDMKAKRMKLAIMVAKGGQK